MFGKVAQPVRHRSDWFTREGRAAEPIPSRNWRNDQY